MGSKRRLWFVYLGGFLMAIHFALITYVDSSLLKKFVEDSTLNILYAIGSLLGVFSLFLTPFLLRKYGSIPVFLFSIIFGALAIFGMGSFSSAILIILLFLIHIAVGPMLYFCLDISMERETKIEDTTGSKRGILLTFSNLAWVISPLALSFLINQNSFSKVYFLSGIILIPLFLLVGIFFRNTKRAGGVDSDIFLAIRSLRKGGDRARITGVQFMLNFFYAWMIIYLPLILSKEMGFSWDKIGIILTIMLLPFILFELPAGFLADKKFGEREILITGFIIMSLATFIIPIISAPVFWIWATVLFATRIGASLIEISSESYFFKHVKADDTGAISLFRIVRPLSYVIAPIIALPIIYFSSYSASFYFLALFSLLGLFFIPKVDTK